MYVPEKRVNGHGSDRAGRLFQVLTLLQEQTLSGEPDKWFTSYEIAHKMGMKPSQYQRSMLYELAEEGAIRYDVENRPCGISRARYRFSHKALSIERWRAWWEWWQPQVQMTLAGLER